MFDEEMLPVDNDQQRKNVSVNPERRKRKKELRISLLKHFVCGCPSRHHKSGDRNCFELWRIHPSVADDLIGTGILILYKGFVELNPNVESIIAPSSSHST